MTPKKSYEQLRDEQGIAYNEAISRHENANAAFDRYQRMIDEGLKDDEWAIDALAYEIREHDMLWDEDNADALAVFGFPGASRIRDQRWKMIHKKALDRALGIEGIVETPQNEYYLLCRRTDPSYTARVAIREWLHENKDVAVGLAQQYWREKDPDNEPFDWDYFEDLIKTMGPWDAFCAGLNADINWGHNWVIIDGYGNYETISDSEFEAKCVALSSESSFVNAIFDGELEIPPDMAEILSIFDVDEDRLTVSACKRSRHALTSKNRKTVSTRSTSRKTKAPTKKKTVSKNKSKPTVSNGKRARMTKTNHFKGGVVTTRKDKIAKQKPKTKTVINRFRGAKQ